MKIRVSPLISMFSLLAISGLLILLSCGFRLTEQNSIIVYAQKNTPSEVQNKHVTMIENKVARIILNGSLAKTNDSLSFFVQTNPLNGTLSKVTPIGPTSAMIMYTPDRDFIGNDTFSYTIRDLALNNMKSGIVTIFVHPTSSVVPSQFRIPLSFIISIATVIIIIIAAIKILATIGKSEQYKKYKGKIFDVIRDDDWYPSLAKFQFLIWTIIVVFSFLFIYFIRLFNGDLSPPIRIPYYLLVVMGISTVVPVISGKISQIKYKNYSPSKPPPTEYPPISTMLEENGEASLTRFQMFAWTWIGILVYISRLFTVIFTTENISQLFVPDLDQIFVVLMGLSQGAYLGGKVYSRMTPDIEEIVPRTASANIRSINILGTNFGDKATGSILFGNFMALSNGTTSDSGSISISHWEDSLIKLSLPQTLTVGKYRIIVRTKDGLMSEPENFEILNEPSLSTSAASANVSKPKLSEMRDNKETVMGIKALADDDNNNHVIHGKDASYNDNKNMDNYKDLEAESKLEHGIVRLDSRQPPSSNKDDNHTNEKLTTSASIKNSSNSAIATRISNNNDSDDANNNKLVDSANVPSNTSLMIYRINDSDRYACMCCNQIGSKSFMMKHDHRKFT